MSDDIQTIKDRVDIVGFIGGYVKLNKANPAIDVATKLGMI